MSLETIINQLASTSVGDEKEVSFSGRGMKLDTEEDAKEVVDAIKNCPGMTVLRLDGNTIGIQAAKAIAKALESQPSFKKALWKDMFTQRTQHEIPDALNFLSSGIILAKSQLVVLDLSDNAFGPRGLKGIVTLLMSPPCYTLQELYLNNNGLGIAGAKMLAGALSKCLEKSRADGHPLSLKVFVCGRNRLENEGSLALSKFLRDVGSLEHIAMPQNGIRPGAIAGLSEAFACNPDLKIMNLEDNTLTEKGASSIANQLHLLNSLETINLGDCLIKTKGAKILANALNHSCPKLKELLLGFNEIQMEGGVEIAKSVENKTNLEKLVLSGNQFGTKGCDIIRDLMSSYGRADELVTLSEDEGSEQDDDENEEDDESENSYESEGDEEKDTSNQNGSLHRSPLLKANLSFKDFLERPSADGLCSLFESGCNVKDVLPQDATYNKYFEVFVKISQLVKPGDEKTEKAACYFSDELLSEAFKLCSKSEMWRFNNDFVVAVKLMKGEDSKPMKNEDLTGIFLVLQHAVQQPYFDETTKTLLQFFMSKPLRLGQASHQSVHGLLKNLYQA